jgi:hypothetical protein
MKGGNLCPPALHPNMTVHRPECPLIRRLMDFSPINYY